MIRDQVLDFFNIRNNSLKIDYDFLSAQVRDYQDSEEYELICKAYDYYEGIHDILQKGRMQLGADGRLEPATNAIDKRLIDNQFGRSVDQKRNYLLGRNFSLDGENESYIEKLNVVFDNALRAKISETATDAIVSTEAYWYPYYDSTKTLNFKRLDRRQVLVLWDDDERSIPHSFIRFYQTVYFDGKNQKNVRHLDYYTPQGIQMWEDDKPVTDGPLPYTMLESGEFVDYWEGKLPLIVWRLNATGKLLFRSVKGLQDALNELKSQVTNVALEDARTTILHIENYGGEMEQDGDIRRKSIRRVIAETGLICTETVDRVGGGVSPITIEFEPEKRMVVVDMLKRTIVDNMRAFDVKDIRDATAPNQMNIKAVYSDLAEDALEMQTQYQKAFDDLLYFINKDLGIEGEDADVIFNTDMMMNETEVIQDIVNSKDILPRETLVAQHPWVTNVEDVMKRIEKEQKEKDDRFYNIESGRNPFGVSGNDEP